MKRFLLPIIAVVLVFVGLGCSDESEDLFSGEVSKDRGALKVLNKDSFIGATIIGNFIDYEIVLFAAGGLDLRNLSATIETADPIYFKGGTYPGEGGTCTETLLSGERCSISIVYEPETTASHEANIRFRYQDALGPDQVSYRVFADSNPILEFDYGTSYDFGNRFVGSSTGLRVRVTNIGRVVAESLSVGSISEPFSFKGGSYPGSGGTCAQRLIPGDSCDIVIEYSPQGNGTHNQQITLNYLNAGRTESTSLNLMAWGFYESQLTISPATSIDWGTVANGEAHDRTLTLTHSGGDVSIGSIAISGLGSQFNYKGGSFPGTGGTCPITLTKAAGSCTIVLSLSSQISGDWSRQISISYFNGRSTQTLSRTLQGRTQQKAVLSFSSPPEIDFGLVKTNTTSDVVITVTHSSGEMSASGLSIASLTLPFGYKGGTFPGGGTCASTVSPGTSCTIIISYAPTSPGVNLISSAKIEYNNGHESVPRALSLRGRTQAVLTSNRASIPFGTVVEGQASKLSFTLTASGGATATSVSITTNDPVYTVLSTNPSGSCGGALSSTCTVEIQFRPPDTSSYNKQVTVSYHDGFQAQSIVMSATGAGGPVAVLTVADWDFGEQSIYSQTVKNITVTNSSSVAALIKSVSLPSGFRFKGGSFPGGGSCSTVTYLSPGTNCTIGVVFNPTAAGTYSGSISLNYENGLSLAIASSTLLGSAIGTSEIFISDFDSVSFGTLFVGQVGVTKKTFTIQQGGADTVVGGIVPSFSPAGEFSIVAGTNTCDGTLAKNESCSFQVEFTPSSIGTRNSTLSISYDGGLAERKLTGVGRAPAVLAISSPAAGIFNSKPTGSNTDVTLTVTRTGSVDATNLSAVRSGSGFQIISGFTGQGGNCPTATMSTATCTIVLRFSPTEVKSYSGSVGIRYFNGFTNVTTSIPLEGSASPSASLSFASESYDFGSLIQSQSKSATITLRHSGEIDAENLSAASLSAPYSYKGGVYPGTGGTCGTVLSKAQGTCSIVVDFNPTTTGLFTKPLEISYETGLVGVRQASINLTGRSVAQAIVSLAAANPLDFGSVVVGSTAEQRLTLTNSGEVNATGLSIAINATGFTFKGGSFPGASGNCSATLAAQASCDVVIVFAPKAAGNFAGYFTIIYNDGLRQQSELRDVMGSGRR